MVLETNWKNALIKNRIFSLLPDITIAIAALAGLSTFVAPCILPMIPAFLAYISGTTISELSQKGSTTLSINRTNIVLNTVFFVLGFSVVFSA